MHLHKQYKKMRKPQKLAAVMIRIEKEARRAMRGEG
jgi:hypothetical protein